MKQKLFTTKLVVLAALLGAMTACKDVLEPEASPVQQSTQANKNVYEQDAQYSRDSFMNHISNVEAAEFYVGKYAKFVPSTNGNNINGIFLIDYEHFLPQSWYYGSNTARFIQRTDGQSTDRTAQFGMDNYAFIVDVDGISELWKIDNVSPDAYNTTFKDMPKETLAQRAKDGMNAIDVGSVAANLGIGYTAYVDYLYDAILNDKGTWSYKYDQISISSKGVYFGKSYGPNAFHYSDFGLVQGIVPVSGAKGKYETFPYFGGIEANRVKDNPKPKHFLGTAYVSVMPTDDAWHPYSNGGITGIGLQVFRTDSMLDSYANYSHGDVADTLYMRFLKWHHVTVIIQHENNKMQLLFSGWPLNTGLAEATWGAKGWKEHVGSQVVDVTQETGLNGAKYWKYNLDNTDYSVEVNLFEPMYFGYNNNPTTGLNYVYCAPKRNAASDGSIEPTEMVIGGVYKEKHPTASGTIIGTEICFVFGGTKW